MNKKITSMFQPSMRLYFMILILFSVGTFFFGQHGRYLAIGEAVIIIFLGIYTSVSNKKRTGKLLTYLESVTDSMDSAAKDSLASFPMPAIIYSLNTSQILWSNSKFIEISGSRKHMFEVRIDDIVPGYNSKWLAEGKSECPGFVELGDRKYKVFGSIVRSERGSAEREFLAATYWIDVTEFAETYDEFINTRPVAAMILLDNYDELLKNLSEKDKSSLLSSIDDRISHWTEGCGGYLSKADRDRYIFIFENRYLKGFIDDKFSVLDSVRQLTGSGGVHATLSIGIGKDGSSLEENFRFASLSIEMALSRGGDQTVIKNKYNFEFFGGQSAEFEKRTKVKSRVMANAFGELLNDASNVFIMGHKFADLDCIGAAVGVCCAARSRGKEARIVVDLENNASKQLIDRMKTIQEYEHAFISAQEAILMADSKSLLVVVDTNRPDQVESETLLISCNRVAVIDHHRRAASYIENPDLNFHEPYSSSASELVSEMLQYIVDQSEILRFEAEALLAGIVLDTKSFSIRTGSRTFDAAAFLRRAGADTAEVKKLLQSDLHSALTRYSIVSNAIEYGHGIALAGSSLPADRVTIAKAADELLNISGITASFVMSPVGNNISISGRSIGDIDVQQILERLGGGGNRSTAGAQLTGTNVKLAMDRLTAAIDEYISYSN